MAPLVLIGGGSCAGKTTISNQIVERLAHIKILQISMHNYYKELDNFSEQEIIKYNFDHPDLIDYHRLFEDLSNIIAGKPCGIPQYNFLTHKRENDIFIEPKFNLIILEGIFALYFKEIVDKANITVFVDTESDLRLVRRIKRDLAERDLSIEDILYQYKAYIKPMHDIFVEPTKCIADIIIPGNQLFEKPLKLMEGYILREIVSSVDFSDNNDSIDSNYG